MLLIPFDRPPEWRRPPVATVVFALLALAVFALLQSGDRAVMDEAMAQYEESGLKARELDAYQAVLTERGTTKHHLLDVKPDSVSPETVFWTLAADPRFMDRLTSGDLALGRDRAWQRDRGALEQALEGSTLWTHSLRPADFQPHTLITHIFLHADIMHLAGNLFFLVAVGFLVEAAMGTRLMAPAFLVVGALAGAADLVVAPDRYIPGVGASGAIAGLMGLYSAVFWTQRVQFFYFIGIYASIARAPALILLPLWLGYEVLAWFQAGDGNSINYAAHAVGLTLGGSAGVALRWFWPGAIDHTYVVEKEQKEADAERREQINECMRALDYGRARPLLREALADHPHDHTLLRQLHLCLRPTPASQAYHEHSRTILQRPETDRATDELVLEVWRDYRQRARPRPRVSPRIVRDLVLRLIRTGHPAEADPLLTSLVRQNVDDPAALGLALARCYQRHSDTESARPWLEMVRQRYPESPEAQRAGELLQTN